MATNSDIRHDNAPIHKTELMIEWFQQEGICAIPWPAKSPDLDIIENVWALLKYYVDNYPQQPRNLRDLARVLKEEGRRYFKFM